MGDRPGYKCYLASIYKFQLNYGMVECKRNGQSIFFKEKKKKFKDIIIFSLLLFAAFTIIISPMLYFMLANDRWLQSDYSFAIFPLIYALVPLVLSLRYWSVSFEVIPGERVAEEKSNYFKKSPMTPKGYLVFQLSMFAFLTFLFFMQSFSAAYIRYSFDILTQNHANWPKAEARIGLVYNDPDSKSQFNAPPYVKGRLPDSANVHVQIDVTNSPNDISVNLNGVSLLPYKDHLSRYHTLWGNDYFFADIDYQVPASLFKSVNTLHVESGYAKGDWTIEITNLNKQ